MKTESEFRFQRGSQKLEPKIRIPNQVVTCILTAQNHIMSNMQDRLLQLMQLMQNRNVSSFSIVITNHFIGEDFLLCQHSMNGYEAMGFDVTQLTQDEEQSLFTIKTIMPIPMVVYGDFFFSGKNMGISFYHQI